MRCKNCAKKFDKWNVPDGCVHHSKQPRFFTCGNPCSKNIAWRNFRKLVTEKTKHLPLSQSSMLQPEELLFVMKFCLQKGTLWYLELAVIILLSCTAFIRNKEMKLIQVGHLRMDLSAVSPLGIIQGLMLHLHNGKTDVGPVLMMLWADEKIPWFDVTWMLLLYLKLTRLRHGHLFPQKKILTAGNLDKAVAAEDTITYGSFCRSFSRVCKEALGVNRRFTGHTPRPTAFCLRSFRGADAAELQHDSRSKSLENVVRYNRGASALRALMETQNKPIANMLKGTYKHHRFESMEMLLAALDKRFNYLSIDHVVDAYFKHIPEFNSIAGYVDFFTGTKKDTLSSIYNDLRCFSSDLHPERDIPVEVLSNLTHLGSRLQRFLILNPRMIEPDLEPDLESESESKTNETADETAGSKRRRVTKAEIPTRKEFTDGLKKQVTPREKLEFLLHYSETDQFISKLLSSEISTSTLVNAHKTWYLQTIKGTLQCLQDHHENDIDKFMQRHRAYKPSRHCNGINNNHKKS